MDTKYQKVTTLFSECEDLFEQEPITALKMMIDLYAEADKVFNHEVADAIDLWVNDNINDEIVKYLQSKIIKNNNIDRIYSNWISNNKSS